MPTFLPLLDIPVAQRRVGRDARAEQRRGGREIGLVGDLQGEGLIDHDAFRVAAVGHAARVLVRPL